MRKYIGQFSLVVLARLISLVIALMIVLLTGMVSLLYFTPLVRESTINDPKINYQMQEQIIEYGKQLIMNTSYYLGPNGTKLQVSNGMTCGNCHLQGGTLYSGNHFYAAALSYPKYRPRSGTVESIEKRINDCFERSLNGQGLDPESIEMKAIVAYILNVSNNASVELRKSSGIKVPALLDRAASEALGEINYREMCANCHGADGQGQLQTDSAFWINPPLWGDHSYNNGAGLYRLSLFAGFIKATMPFGVTYKTAELTDEEAWDIAAYVNSKPRPKMNLNNDWPDISQKPFDYPFGPFTDGFTEEQHKYGPFKPILEAQK